MRDTAQLFADEGFVAIAPDLLSRASGRLGEPAGRLSVTAVSLDQTVEDSASAFNFLQSASYVDSERISVVGFGWGGWRAFKLAELTPSLYRAIVSYGTTSDDGRLDQIRARVLAHYAEYDFQTTAQALATKRRLGRRFTYHLYPEMDRGFFGGSSGEIDYVALIRGRESGPNDSTSATASSEVAVAVQLAWDRTLAFLQD